MGGNETNAAIAACGVEIRARFGGMIYNPAVQKQNTRNSSRVAPRKLALLVAAVLAGPAAAGPIAYGTYIGNASLSDDGGFLKVDAAGNLFSARTNWTNELADASVVTLARLTTSFTPPGTTGPGTQVWTMPLRDNLGNVRMGGLALSPAGTPYTVGTTTHGL